jgi:hypothetical protein
MDLDQFLLRLQGSGRVTVGRDGSPEPGDLASVLRDIDAAVRIDAPAGLPELDLPAAVWAAERLYAACALFAYRDLDARELQGRLGVVCPSPIDRPSTHYAVDLTFRHLPELLQLARGLSPDDLLVQYLYALAAAWPLSSVGMRDLGEVDVTPLCANDGLRRLYVDRVLRHDDRERAVDPRIARAIAAAVGEHREFAKSVLAVHDALQSTEISG